MTFNAGAPDEKIERDRAELKRLLRLDPKGTEFKMVFGANAAAPNEIAVITRSMMQVMATMASEVEVPPQHVTDGRASPGRQDQDAAEQMGPVIRIRSTLEEPIDAYVAIPYRGH